MTNPNRPGLSIKMAHAHKFTFGCYHGYGFLARERVHGWFSESIESGRNKFGMQAWGYVFMPNHVRLVIHFGEENYEIAKLFEGNQAACFAKRIDLTASRCT